MPSASLIAPAKINLALHVGAVQPDGYHPVDTLCAFLDAGDRVSIEGRADEFSVQIDGPFAAALTDAPQGTTNLILTGARLLADAIEVPMVRFGLHKAVPAASGIGGGTANGAAAMVLLNRLAPQPLSADALIRLARGLGADGPICMASLVKAGRVSRAQGIGERVSNGPATPPFTLAIANPGLPVSTGRVFHVFDDAAPPAPFELNIPARFSTLSQLVQWAKGTRNDLQSPAVALEPVIEEGLTAMRQRPGCMAARMSGSGATLFGLFNSATAARRGARWFAGQGWWSTAGWASHGVGGLG